MRTLTPTATAADGYLTTNDTTALRIGFTDPSGAMGVVLPRVTDHTPFRNVVLTSSDSRSGMYIDSVDVDIRPESAWGDDGGRAALSQYWHLLPVLRLYVLSCPSVEDYKVSGRAALKEWVTRVAGLPVPGHWMVLHVTPEPGKAKNKSKASRFKKSLLSKIKSDVSVYTSKSPLAPHVVQLLLDDHEADWLARMASVRAAHPDASAADSPLTSPPSARKYEDLTHVLAGGLMAGFSAREAAFKAELAHLENRIDTPGWNYCSYFVVKEGLALLYEQASLHVRALEIYEDLAHMYESGEAPLLPGLLTEFGTLEFGLVPDVFALTSLPYRGLMFESKISVVEWHLYVTGRRLGLLAALGDPDQMVDVALAFFTRIAPSLATTTPAAWVDSDDPDQSPATLAQLWLAAAALSLLPQLHTAADDPDGAPPLTVSRLVAFAAAHLGAFGAAVGSLPYTSFEAALRAKPDTPIVPLAASEHAADAADACREKELEGDDGEGEGKDEPQLALDALGPRMASPGVMRRHFYPVYTALLHTLVEVYSEAGRVRSASLARAELGFVALVQGSYSRAATLLADLVDRYRVEAWPGLYAMAMLQLTASQRAALASAHEPATRDADLIRSHAVCLLRLLERDTAHLPFADLAAQQAQHLLDAAAMWRDTAAGADTPLELDATASLAVRTAVSVAQAPVLTPIRFAVRVVSHLAAELPVSCAVVVLEGRDPDSGEVVVPRLRLATESSTLTTAAGDVEFAPRPKTAAEWRIVGLSLVAAPGLVLQPGFDRSAVLFTTTPPRPVWDVRLVSSSVLYASSWSSLRLELTHLAGAAADPLDVPDLRLSVRVDGPVELSDSHQALELVPGLDGDTLVSGGEDEEDPESARACAVWELDPGSGRTSRTVQVPIMVVRCGAGAVSLSLSSACAPEHDVEVTFALECVALFAVSARLIPGYAQLSLENLTDTSVSVTEVGVEPRDADVALTRVAGRPVKVGPRRTLGAVFTVPAAVPVQHASVVADVAGVGVWRGLVTLAAVVPQVELTVTVGALTAHVFAPVQVTVTVSGAGGSGSGSAAALLTVSVDESVWVLAGKTVHALTLDLDTPSTTTLTLTAMPLAAGQVPVPTAALSWLSGSDGPTVAAAPTTAVVRVDPALETITPCTPTVRSAGVYTPMSP